MSASAFITITRPHNAVVAGLTALIGYLIATGTLTPPSLLLAVAVALITAGGNVINDVFDLEIDRINRPTRPIPAGEISLAGAKAYAATLFAGGLLVAALTTPLCLAIALVNSVILIVYAVRLKKTPFLGNVAVAYLTASVFLFGGAFAGIEGLVRNLSLAAITFLATVARELLKDAEDVDGDAAGGARTLPMIVGVRRTGIFAFACACGAVAVSLLPFGDWWGLFYLAGIAVVDLVILFGAFRGLRCTTPGCVRVSRATSILRAGMFAALVVFAIAAVI
jgi:geranylgeranylglycerol-phosphate geranylgeranyltransferase